MPGIPLIFPFGGYHRGFAYQQQPPYTSPDCRNVWPVGTFENRLRGGSRPGLEKTYAQQLGVAGNRKIRLATRVRMARTDGLTFWSDDFDSPAGWGSDWSVYAYDDPGDPLDDWIALPTRTGANLTDAYSTPNNPRGAIRAAVDDFDASSTYQWSMYIAPQFGNHQGLYYLMFRADDTTPQFHDDGVVVTLGLHGDTGEYSLVVKEYASATPTTHHSSTGETGESLPGWLTCTITGNVLYVYWLGSLLATVNPLGAAAGERMGLGIRHAGNSWGDADTSLLPLIDSCLLRYYRSTYVESTRTVFVAAAGGKLYRESATGTLAEPDTTLALVDDRTLQAVERNQKLFIADYDEPAVENTGGHGEVTGTSFDDTTNIPDWTDTGDADIRRTIVANNDVIVISNGTGDVTDATYQIDTVAAGSLTLGSSPGTSGTCDYTIRRGPKVFDPADDTVVVWEATAGSVPSGCPHVCLYNDRLVLANETAWFMSRQGDPYDWDYSATIDDVGRPMYGAAADSGMIAEELTAVFPVGRDYLIFACADQLWRMRGDPAIGGRLDAVDRTIGIVGGQAWCHGIGNEVFFLGRTGFYRLGPEMDAIPEPLSQEVLPDGLRNVDPETHEAVLEFDAYRQAVHIYVTKRSDQSGLHYWWHRPTETFWPMLLNEDHEPFTACRYPPAARNESALIIGSRDGYIRNYTRAAALDDAESLSSHVVYGPIRLGGSDDRDGILASLVGALAEDSGPVDWSLYVGKNHEAVNTAVADDDAFATAEWTAGYNHTARPRGRGGSFAIKLANAEANQAWAVEQMTVVRQPAGRVRA